MDVWNEVTLFALPMYRSNHQVVSQDETSGEIQAVAEKDGLRS